VQDDHAFNEYLEVVYEYGIIGVVAAAGVSVGLLARYAYGIPLAPRFDVALLVWALTMAGSLTLRTWPFPLVGALLFIAAVWP
jgi:hypothetical protein